MCRSLCTSYILVTLRNFKKKKTLALQHISVQSVATIGNTLNSVHLAVEAIQKTVDEHKKTMESLQSDMVRKSTNATEVSILPALFCVIGVMPSSHSSQQTLLCTFLKDIICKLCSQGG